MISRMINSIGGGDYKARRAVFTYLVVLLSMGAMYHLGLTTDTQSARAGIESFSWIAIVSLTSYLGISVADRSGVMSGLAAKLSGGKAPEPTK